MNDWLGQLLFGFRFESPWMLCALVLLPLWAWLRGRYSPVAAVQYSSVKLLQVASRRPRFRRGSLIVLMRLSALNLLILALARPQMERGFMERETPGINIAFALDFSSRMQTRDFAFENKRVSRIEAVRAVLAEFIRSHPNDRIAAIRFSDDAHVVSPLTSDHEWLLDRLAFEETGRGSLPGAGMLVAAETLKAAQQHRKVLITVTTAERDSKEPRSEDVARAIVPLGIKSHIIQIVEFASSRKLAEGSAALKNAAGVTGGAFFQVSDASMLRDVLQQIREIETPESSEKRQKSYRELMGWFAWPAGLFLLVELMFTHWVWRRLP